MELVCGKIGRTCSMDEAIWHTKYLWIEHLME